MARPARRSGNLPAEATSFVGRRRELAEVRTKLTEARLVSLVGPGGVGKTRLAIRAGTDLGRGFRDGAWLAELAEITDADLVDGEVLAALDLRDQAAIEPLALLRSYLRDRELLLVVDNCEHLLEAAARLVADLLRAAPGLRVIATSREPLSVAGEHVVPVPPLELPDPDPGGLEALRRSEAVMLFTERAAAACGTFELTDENQATVVDLCRRLDGLPLAIELAAVRTRVLSPAQVLDRLADRFSLLTGGSRGALPRHQTLRTTIEWSHDLLTEDERAVLRQCCAFAGRFTLDDVEAVCSSADSGLDVMSSLVDKSLVTKEDAGGLACYRLHETMREFASLKLAEAGEQESVALRCAEYYHAACRRSARERRYGLLDWLEWADLEIDNVRAVMQQCVSRGDASRGIDLAATLGWFWITRATTEGIRWLDAFLALAEERGNTDGRGWGYFMRGFLAVLKADPAGSRPALRTAVAVARETGQRELLAEALAMAAVAEDMAGEYAAAGVLIGEADLVTEALDHYPSARVGVLQAQTLHAFFAGDQAAARAAAAEGVRRARETGDLYTQVIMLLNLGSAALNARDLAGAEPLLTEAMRLAYQIDDRVAQFYLLDAFGCHAAMSGRARRAAQLFGAAETLRAEVGANVMPFLAPLLDRERKSALAALGEAKFRAGFEAGQRLDRDGGLRLALGEPAGDGSGSAGREPGRARSGAGGSPRGVAPHGAVVPGGGTAPLAKREADVARLIADGLTNKQIGARLFISERTVDSHVRSILNKLGVGSRAQIAAWVATLDQ